MGYTHYYSFNKAGRGDAAAVEVLYQSTLKEAQHIINAYQRMAVSDERLSGYSAHTTRYGGIKINGVSEDSHEDFVLREHFNQNAAEFCKTARKPYDIVVVAILCLLKYRLGDLVNIQSDGDVRDWSAGAAFAQLVLKRKIGIPTSIRGSIFRGKNVQ